MILLNLEDKEWREYFIGGDNGVFNISSSSSGIDKNKLMPCVDENSCYIPYITRTDTDNGVNKFISQKQDDKYSLDNGNVITIGLDTQTVFFQPHRFYTGQNIQVLRHKKLNKYNAEFLIPLLKVQMEKFNWGGNGATLGRLFRTRIMLPVDSEGKLDWLFMEKYAKAVFEKKKSEFGQYSKRALKLVKFKKIGAIKDRVWSAFFIEEVAEILPGKDIYDSERVVGVTPYISSTSKSNGIGYFIGNNNITLEKNCLSVNRNGSVGYSFFHKYEGLFSNDCRKLKLKYNSSFVGFFIANQITMQRKKYNYGYKMGTGRLRRQKIMLPVVESGEPDYEYMEQYIINIEHKKRKQYIDFIENISV